MKLTIGALQQLSGMSRTTLRYYDAEGLIDPERMENGYRQYTERDLMNLVQLRQMNAFGIELSGLPAVGNRRTCGDVHEALVTREQEIEEEIEALYQKLARLRLHEGTYRRCAGGDTAVAESRMIGAYRLFLREGSAEDPVFTETFRSWMEAVPDTYACVRIPLDALFLPDGAEYGADVGVGLLSAAFRRLGKPLAPPVEYAPPCKCIEGMLRLKRIDRIPSSALAPFRDYIESHGLVPLGDFHGWVVYSPVRDDDEFHISLRLGVN